MSAASADRMVGRRRLMGLLCAAPLPVLGYAFPLASLVAVASLGLRGAALGRTVRGLVVLTVAVLTFLVVNSQLRSVELPTPLPHLLALALFLTAAARAAPTVRSATHLLGATALGTALFYVLIGTENTSDSFDHLWKYGLGMPLVVLVLVVLVHLTTSRTAVVLTLAVAGSLSIFLGFRSHGLICIGTVFVVLLSVPGTSRRARMIGGAVGAAALAVVLPRAISDGFFGAEVARRTRDQAVGDGGSLLLAGRAEPPLSFAAIGEHPLLGWGNPDAVTSEVVSRAMRLAADLGLDPATALTVWITDDGTVALHSILFELWVAGGLVAAVLPLTLVVLLAKAAFTATPRYAPVLVLVSLQGIWDLLFSPWVYNRAVLIAVTVVLAVRAIEAAREDGRGRVRADDPGPAHRPADLTLSPSS